MGKAISNPSPRVGEGNISAAAQGLAARFLLLFALFFAALTPAAAQDFPKLTGRVVDQAGILGDADEVSLTQQLAALELRTGRQVVVATVPSLQGYPIEDFGYQLGRTWGIGSKENNDGVLLLVAPEEFAQAAAAAQVPPTGRRRRGGTCTYCARRRQRAGGSSGRVLFAPGRPVVCKRGLLPAAHGLSGDAGRCLRLRTTDAAVWRAVGQFWTAVAAGGHRGRTVAAGGKHTRVCRRIWSAFLVSHHHFCALVAVCLADIRAASAAGGAGMAPWPVLMTGVWLPR